LATPPLSQIALFSELGERLDAIAGEPERSFARQRREIVDEIDRVLDLMRDAGGKGGGRSPTTWIRTPRGRAVSTFPRSRRTLSPDRRASR
jgi:hypothetical protein